MSKTKHTPGPWAVYADTLPFEINGQPRFHTTRRIGTVAHHPQLHGPEPVVYLSSGLGPHTFVGIKESDANLIAAAPDLLAALKRIIKDTECWYIDGNPCAITRRNVPCAHCEAEAAVQKAEGAF